MKKLLTVWLLFSSSFILTWCFSSNNEEIVEEKNYEDWSFLSHYNNWISGDIFAITDSLDLVKDWENIEEVISLSATVDSNYLVWNVDINSTIRSQNDEDISILDNNFEWNIEIWLSWIMYDPFIWDIQADINIDLAILSSAWKMFWKLSNLSINSNDAELNMMSMFIEPFKNTWVLFSDMNEMDIDGFSNDMTISGVYDFIDWIEQIFSDYPFLKPIWSIENWYNVSLDNDNILEIYNSILSLEFFRLAWISDYEISQWERELSDMLELIDFNASLILKDNRVVLEIGEIKIWLVSVTWFIWWDSWELRIENNDFNEHVVIDYNLSDYLNFNINLFEWEYNVFELTSKFNSNFLDNFYEISWEFKILFDTFDIDVFFSDKVSNISNFSVQEPDTYVLFWDLFWF